MSRSSSILVTPREADLGLTRIVNRTGLSISLLQNGAIFAIEHCSGERKVMINQIVGSPIAGSMGRLCLRIGGPRPQVLQLIGPEARARIGALDDRFVWEGEQQGLRHQVNLWLAQDVNAWFWRIHAANQTDREQPLDTVLIQDLGLGDRGFLMNNEAYASEYVDCHVAEHPRMNHVLMSRQNLSQGGSNPWTAHGCLEGTAGFATDFVELMGAAHRDANEFDLPFGSNLRSSRLQRETACAALQSRPVLLAAGAAASWTFFGFYKADHAAASSNADLAEIDAVERASQGWSPREVSFSSRREASFRLRRWLWLR